MSAALAQVPPVPVTVACRALGVARATLYRRRRRTSKPPRERRPAPPRALDAGEREKAVALLHSERFVDRAPEQIVATLLDEGEYLCSPRTLYRLLADRGELVERRRRRVHPVYQRPELVASAPNRVWSWDLTKLRGPEKWRYFHLYLLLDLFSRFVVGWLLARHESGELARRLLAESCARQGIVPGPLPEAVWINPPQKPALQDAPGATISTAPKPKGPPSAALPSELSTPRPTEVRAIPESVNFERPVSHSH